MNGDPVTWLVQEVRDLLDVSPVGLYEFLWLLRGGYPDLDDGQLRRHAQAALTRLVAGEDVCLARLDWPDNQHHGDLDPGELTDEAWTEPRHDQTYIALLPR